NAACPIKMMRIVLRARRSGFEMLGEEVLQAIPGITRRIGTIRIAFVTKEPVRGTAVHLYVRGLLELGEPGTNPLDLVVRNERVLIAKKQQQWCAHVRGEIEQTTDTAAVERRGGSDTREPAGGEKCHASAHAKAGHSDPIGGDEVATLQVGQCRFH